jgi:hypothetical protein
MAPNKAFLLSPSRLRFETIGVLFVDFVKLFEYAVCEQQRTKIGEKYVRIFSWVIVEVLERLAERARL